MNSHGCAPKSNPSFNSGIRQYVCTAAREYPSMVRSPWDCVKSGTFSGIRECYLWKIGQPPIGTAISCVREEISAIVRLSNRERGFRESQAKSSPKVPI